MIEIWHEDDRLVSGSISTERQADKHTEIGKRVKESDQNAEPRRKGVRRDNVTETQMLDEIRTTDNPQKLFVTKRNAHLSSAMQSTLAVQTRWCSAPKVPKTHNMEEGYNGGETCQLTSPVLALNAKPRIQIFLLATVLNLESSRIANFQSAINEQNAKCTPNHDGKANGERFHHQHTHTHTSK